MPTASERQAMLDSMSKREGGENQMADTGTDDVTMTPVDPSDIPDIVRSGRALRTIEAFLNGGAQAVAVEAKSKSFVASLKRQIKAGHLPAEAFTRQGVTYLKRTDNGSAPEGE